MKPTTTLFQDKLALIAHDKRSTYSDLFEVLALAPVSKEMIDQLPKDYKDIVLTLMKEFIEAEDYMSNLIVVEKYTFDYNLKADDYTDASSGEILRSHYEIYWNNLESIKTLYDELV